MEVVRRDPELSIEPGEGGAVVVSLRPYPDQTGPGEAEFLFRMATATRCEVTRFTDSHMELLEAIPSDGVEIPPEAAPRLVEAVSALAPVMRVQSAAEGEAGTLPHVEADPVPRVRLVPFEDGLAVSLAVEPVAGSGIRFDAGASGATVFATLDGQSVQARRDLDAERAALEALIERCPLLSPRPTERRPLRLPDPADCLELLEALEDSATPCEWPEGQPLRVVARAAASSLRLNVKSVGEWVRASGKLVVDETRVFDLKPLLELLDENPGTRFVPLESGQFLALTDTFRRQLDDLRSLSTPAARGAVRLHPAAALAVSGLIEGAELTADRGWRDLRASVAEAQSYQPEVPGTLRAELRPYQVDGYRWLARLARWGAGACLADDMGLGKTVQALALLLRRAPDGPALVVAPTSVLANWVTEAGRFAPTLNVTVYAGPAASRARLLESSGPFDLVVTSYGLLQNDADQLTGVSWGTVVLDEAQAIKNAATKRARAARRLDAGFRVATTGTPIQNNLMELHSLFGFINPGLLGSETQFRRNFAVAIERGGEDDVRARLKRLIAPFILRRLKTEVLQDLPERTEITLHVKLSSEEVALYEALRQRTVAALETAAAGGEGARRIQVLAHLTRLRLACCHPRLVLDRVGADAPAETLRSSKLEAFAETLSELLENRHKVLVFSQFVMHMKLVEEYLKGAGISYQYLDGSTPRRARAERINAFQTGRGDVFLISLKAGGLGLNLTAADYVIHLDPWWNPAVEDQASDRAHRIGQTRPVTIYRLITEGTIEEQIVDLHHRKRNLADRLLEGADGAASLSADELLKLLEQPLGVRAVPSA